MDWVLSTFIIMIVFVIVVALIIIGIYKLTSKNAKEEEEV